MWRQLVYFHLLISTSIATPALHRLLPPEHSCNSLNYRTEVDVDSMTGTWYVLAIICSSWNRVPLCDRVEFQGNSTLLHETWSSLDLMADPRYRNRAVYRTDLLMVQPGFWQDLSQERDHPITLVLDTGELLVLALCYLGSYATPYHDHEVFIFARTTEHHLLEYTLLKLAARGLDIRQAQILPWSMCPHQ